MDYRYKPNDRLIGRITYQLSKLLGFSRKKVKILGIVVVVIAIFAVFGSATTGLVYDVEMLRDQLNETECALEDTQQARAECQQNYLNCVEDKQSCLNIIEEKDAAIATTSNELSDCNEEKAGLDTSLVNANDALDKCSLDLDDVERDYDVCVRARENCEDDLSDLEHDYDRLAENAARSICCLGRAGSQVEWGVEGNQIVCTGGKTIECT